MHERIKKGRGPERSERKTQRVVQRVATSTALAALCLWLAVRDVDPGRLFADLGDVYWGWIVSAGLLSIGVSAIHCTKTKVLMARAHHLEFRTVFSADLVSVLMDIVLPFRLQELVKAYIIGRAEKVRASLVFGVQVVERAIEVPFLLGLLSLLVFVFPLPTWAISAVLGGVIAAFVLLAALVCVVAFPKPVARVSDWLDSSSVPGTRVVAGIMGQLVSGVRLGATSARGIAAVAGITCLEWAVLAAAVWGAAAAVGIRLSPWETLALLMVNFVAHAVPAKPSGALGVYELAGKTLLTLLFGMAPSEALSIVIAVHATLIGFGLLGGLLGIALMPGSVAELRRSVSKTPL